MFKRQKLEITGDILWVWFCKKINRTTVCRLMLEGKALQPALKDCFVIVLVLVALNCLKYVDFL